MWIASCFGINIGIKTQNRVTGVEIKPDGILVVFLNQKAIDFLHVMRDWVVDREDHSGE